MELGALPRGLTQGGFLHAAAAILCSEAGSGPELGRQVLWKQLWPQVSQAASLLQICPPTGVLSPDAPISPGFTVAWERGKSPAMTQ